MTNRLWMTCPAGLVLAASAGAQPPAGHGHYFPADSPWYQDISNAPVALTAQSDRFTTAKWAGRLGPHDLATVKITDFQMVDGGKRFNWTGDCTRTTPLFYDGFELGTPSKWSHTVP